MNSKEREREYQISNLEHRICRLIPQYPAILEMENPSELFAVAGINKAIAMADVSHLYLAEWRWALTRAQTKYKALIDLAH